MKNKVTFTVLIASILNSAQATNNPTYISIKGNAGITSITTSQLKIIKDKKFREAEELIDWNIQNAKKKNINDDYKSELNYGFSGAIGINVYPLRIELEYSHRLNNDFENKNKTYAIENKKDVKYKTQILSANVYYDFTNFTSHNSTALIPYIGVGIGYARVNIKNTKTSENLKGNKYAFHINPGVNYKINNNVSLDVEYLFTHLSELKNKERDILKSEFKSRQNQHHFNLGIRYSF